MKQLLVALILCGGFLSAHAQTATRKPEKLTMTLALIADAEEPSQYVFVINGVVAYKTMDGLKTYVKGLPKSATLTWAPGCDQGLGPLDSSEERREFSAFCKSCGIKFILVPSG